MYQAIQNICNRHDKISPVCQTNIQCIYCHSCYNSTRMGSVGNENLGIVSPKVNFIAENDFVNNSNISGLTLIHWLDCRLFFPFLTSTNPNYCVLKLLFVRYTT